MSNTFEVTLTSLSVVLNVVVVITKNKVNVFANNSVPKFFDRFKPTKTPISKTNQDVVLHHLLVYIINNCGVHSIQSLEITSLPNWN